MYTSNGCGPRLMRASSARSFTPAAARGTCSRRAKTMIRSYRLQITTWYLALFSLLFVVFSIFLYGIVARALRNRLDEALAAESRTAAALFSGELQELAGDESAAAAEA